MARQQWSSRSTFVMAAVGSAVGLGNAWRFPGIAYQKRGRGIFSSILYWPYLHLESHY